MKSEDFWKAVGGRKQFNGYVYATLLSVMAVRMETFPFDAYALWLAAALLGTSVMVAAEDRAKNLRPPGSRRSTDTEARG